MSTLFQSPDLYSETDTPRRQSYSVPDRRRGDSLLRLIPARAWWLLVACLAVTALWYIDPGRTYVAPPPPPPETIIDLSPERVRIELFVLTKQHVRDVLLAPASAKFPASWETGILAHDGAVHRYRISGYVDSQNVFGAMLRTPYEVTVHYGCAEYQPYRADCWNIQRVQVGSQVYKAAR